jgi:aspartyl/glutamyl-tRNA(Asn/Gln) amidotransferase C subunit
MKIKKEEVLKISSLSRLSIKDDEIDSFMENFSEIIEYINLLGSAGDPEVEIEEVVEEYSIRDDTKIVKLNVEEVVKNSNNVENNFFAVSKVIDDE